MIMSPFQNLSSHLLPKTYHRLLPKAIITYPVQNAEDQNRQNNTVFCMEVKRGAPVQWVPGLFPGGKVAGAWR